MDNLRLPGPDDPLRTCEQIDLEQQLAKGALSSLLPDERQNVQRLTATLKLYRRIMDERGIFPDGWLPKRVTRNGIDYIPVDSVVQDGACCEHGVADGEYCEPCNLAYKRAARENGFDDE